MGKSYSKSNIPYSLSSTSLRVLVHSKSSKMFIKVIASIPCYLVTKHTIEHEDGTENICRQMLCQIYMGFKFTSSVPGTTFDTHPVLCVPIFMMLEHVEYYYLSRARMGLESDSVEPVPAGLLTLSEKFVWACKVHETGRWAHINIKLLHSV